MGRSVGKLIFLASLKLNVNSPNIELSLIGHFAYRYISVGNIAIYRYVSIYSYFSKKCFINATSLLLFYCFMLILYISDYYHKTSSPFLFFKCFV